MKKFWNLLALVGAVTISTVYPDPAAAGPCIDPPGYTQITVWQHADFKGACTTLDIGSYRNSGFLSPVPSDSISSLKVGKGVRAHLFKHANFNTDKKNDDEKDLVALYEAGSIHNHAGSGPFELGPGVADETTSIIVQETFGVRIPYLFVNDYPSDRENIFAHEAQGLCHTRGHWFITRNKPSTLYKIPLSKDLNAGNPSVAQTGIPPSLQARGYNHMGDLDCINGWLFVPLEHESCTGRTWRGAPPRCDRPGMVAVYRASDLAFVNWDYLSLNSDQHAGWVAIDPSNGGNELWTSNTEIHGSQDIVKYRIDWGHVPDIRSHFLISIGPAVTVGGFGGLKNQVKAPLSIKGLQGGVFDTTGRALYLSNSDRGSADGHGIHVFLKSDGTWLGRTGNDYGPFRYTTSGLGENHEEEGLDYLPTNPSITPGIEGDLHAIMLNNDWDWWTGLDQDNVYIKHYKRSQQIPD